MWMKYLTKTKSTPLGCDLSAFVNYLARLVRSVASSLLVQLFLSSFLVAAPPLPPNFESDVLPLLIERCSKCHGEERRISNLSVLTASDLMKGAQSGPVVIAGKPEESTLLERLISMQMPPNGEGEPFNEEELDLIRRWISAGAKTDEPVAQTQITDERILPLLQLRCVSCHGGRRREADLDIRTVESLLRGGKSGPAIVSGKPDESLLLKRIHAGEMPPRRQLVAVSVKPMEASEIEILQQWIADGLPIKDRSVISRKMDSDPLVSQEDREFWSFVSPKLPAIPFDKLAAADRDRIVNPIDIFILAKLRQLELSPADQSDRATLIKRLYFDLLGLPPTFQEVQQFVADKDESAYEKLVDRQLASPHYGERWGRHWLDVAGYSDSEGGQNEDFTRPNMWRYRDYVIQAFNSDPGYDQFILEQIAGDELVDYENAETITEDIYRKLCATGFLRTAPDRTFANITNFVPERLEVIADEIQILGSSILGLTIHCCRCHSHKFDPLPQRDYFRLAAMLKDGYDENDWIGSKERNLKFVTTDERKQWEATIQGIESELKKIESELATCSDEAKKKALMEQKTQWESKKTAEPTIRALWSRGDPSPTYILRRGNYLTPGELVSPGIPSVLCPPTEQPDIQPPRPSAKSVGSRLALAKWLASPRNPLTARVMVNRIWKHHFGTGLVASLDNFGKMGSAPSHPELLDWLAVRFMEHNWSIKSLHRIILTSATYRQSSQKSDAANQRDPDNRWLSHMPLRRLEAEAVRDRLLVASGNLKTSFYGVPSEVDIRGDGLVTVRNTGNGERRSVYLLHRRTAIPTLLDTFDSPQMGPNCVMRAESVVAPQALHLLNNAAVHQLAKLFADRVRREAGDEYQQQLRLAFQIAYSEEPSPEQLTLLTHKYEELSQAWLSSLAGQENTKQAAKDKALENVCHALMNSAAFIYVE